MGLRQEQKNERLGETRKNKESLGGCEMKIIKYNGYKDIIVEFQDKHKTKIHTTYQHFEKGDVKNPYYPSVYGVGYIGEGKYKITINNKKTDAYKVWYGMLQRCYDPYMLNKRPTYIDCYICEEWHNFQNFAKWFYKHYYECNGEKMHLDKDILFKGNKIYSPENCILVPERINTLFIKCDASRGKYPIGVCWDKENNKFRADYSILDKNNEKKRIHLGRYNTFEEAFNVYKKFKENYIKDVADKYKKIIPIELYDAMYRYEVEIDD